MNHYCLLILCNLCVITDLSELGSKENYRILFEPQFCQSHFSEVDNSPKMIVCETAVTLFNALIRALDSRTSCHNSIEFISKTFAKLKNNETAMKAKSEAIESFFRGTIYEDLMKSYLEETLTLIKCSKFVSKQFFANVLTANVLGRIDFIRNVCMKKLSVLTYIYLFTELMVQKDTMDSTYQYAEILHTAVIKNMRKLLNNNFSKPQMYATLITVNLITVICLHKLTTNQCYLILSWSTYGAFILYFIEMIRNDWPRSCILPDWFEYNVSCTFLALLCFFVESRRLTDVLATGNSKFLYPLAFFLQFVSLFMISIVLLPSVIMLVFSALKL